MATRPNIKLLKGVDNNVYALLNAQTGYPAVTVGAALRIQNKGGPDVYIQEGLASIEVNGGTTLTTNKQACTKSDAVGVIATCINNTIINVEVI
ncbi:hypothetical protein PP586_gp52 [Pseudoalteromonas phage vB_PspS-H40/1]|uniref:hypothetical protein n=1 Tax=Pseudoalteromonas phage vB_PspS-H40/1 TaxID=1856120 RepID=UPI0007DD7A62|nr:hypothetical protein PP586_gp52 [Pseudoalteromonas phage vB_PspS-H40/1]ANI22069.1 hypothetical protein H401_52 [Pseudoalteromonas phage vB_PspS-H40/1]